MLHRQLADHAFQLSEPGLLFIQAALARQGLFGVLEMLLPPADEQGGMERSAVPFFVESGGFEILVRDRKRIAMPRIAGRKASACTCQNYCQSCDDSTVPTTYEYCSSWC
jgi:hypothetical protein